LAQEPCYEQLSRVVCLTLPELTEACHVPSMRGQYYDSTPLAFGTEGIHKVSLRERISASALALSILGPWIVFCVIFGWTSLFYDENNMLMWLILACGVSASVILAVAGFMANRRGLRSVVRPDTWLFFLSVTVFLASVAGFDYGADNFAASVGPHAEYGDMAHFTDVDPDANISRAYIDAGLVTFRVGTMVKTDLSIGYKDGSVYCVVPITFNNSVRQHYNYWAVGKDCCTGHPGDFHCGTRSDVLSEIYSGLRLLSESDRPKFDIALQQAEAHYGINASNSLLFYWSQDLNVSIEAFHTTAVQTCVFVVVGYLMFQTILAVCALFLYTQSW